MTHGRPAAVLQAAFGRKLRTDLAEHGRLQLRQVLEGSAHAAGGVVLGQPIGGEDEREAVAVGVVVVLVAWAREPLASWIRPLAVEPIGERRLLRFEVGRERSVDQAGRCVQPGAAVGLHDERVFAGDHVLGLGALRRHVVRVLGRLEVGDVVARPLLFALVPPHVALALRPGPALRVGGGAVVEDAPVRRPCPSPLRRHPRLLRSAERGAPPGWSRLRTRRSRSSSRTRWSRPALSSV